MPRKMFTSMGSRSRRAINSSTAGCIPASWQGSTTFPAVPSRAFPDGFRWGTATAAHQVEGGNTNNDWWAWEHRPDSVCAESSGDACDQWHRYAADIELLAGLGFDNYRFSLEWSRIEPAEGEYSRV